MSNNMILIYTTMPTIDEAQELGTQSIKKKLAACVNMFPGGLSIYQWNNAFLEDQEVIMFFKTKTDLKEQLIDFILKHHPYDIPAIIALDATTTPDFLSFINQETK